jgi:hypothetical protein
MQAPLLHRLGACDIEGVTACAVLLQNYVVDGVRCRLPPHVPGVLRGVPTRLLPARSLNIITIANSALPHRASTLAVRSSRSGRKPKMTPAKLRLAQAAMGKRGTIVADLCKELGVSSQTLYRHVSPTGQLRGDAKKLISEADP